MTTWAVVPVKSFGRGKSRLLGLSRVTRIELARELMARTMGAIAASESIAGCLVATDCDDIASQMTTAGHLVQRDLPEEPLGQIIDRGLVRVEDAGATRAVVLMSDLPLITAADIGELTAWLATVDAVIAPDRADAGTNAIGLRLPAVGPTCFGHEDSFARHVRALGERTRASHILRNPRLALDVDLPGDLDVVAADLLSRKCG